MQQTLLDSTALSRITYDAAAMRLEVEFRDGTLYRYDGVPPAVHAALLRAKSKGRFLNTAIRGHFPYAFIGTALDSSA
jgi:KTSC domain